MHNTEKKATQLKFYRRYSALRKKLIKYNAQDVINYCIRYLAQDTQDKIGYLRLHPWLVLLLLKWAILDEKNFRKKENLSPASFNKLLNMLFDMRDIGGLPSSASDPTLFFRLIAYQQFLYQEEIKFSHLARQFFYFDNLDEEHFIKLAFLSETKISINCFLDLSIGLVARFMGNNFISVSYFSNVFSSYTTEQIEIFLDLFTKDSKSTRKYLNTFNGGARSVDEIYEQSYLTFFPLIKFGNHYVCAEKHVLWRCIEHFIYDFMRRWNAQKFMNEFGLIFEGAIARSILNSTQPHYTETQIKECFSKGKLVDFIITEEHSNILIESKSVEMAYQGKVSNLTSVVESKSQSIIESIDQAFGFISKLRQSTALKYPIDKNKSTYLIVVTYKDFYLGNGLTFYNGIAKSSIDKIIQKFGETLIPLENIYFLNVDEFDLLMEIVRSEGVSITDILEKAKRDDLNPSTRKFNFSIHLASERNHLKNPQHLIEIMNEKIDRLVSALS